MTPDPNDTVAIALILADRIKTLEQENQRLRGLLAEMLYELSFCPICATDLIEDNTYISLPHANDCRLMKELSDA